MLTRVSKAMVFLLLAGSEPRVWAQGVNPATSPTNTSHALIRWFGTEEPPIAWGAVIGSSTQPIGLERDPAGSAWVTQFQTANGDPILANAAIWIVERLKVTGDRPWTGWHVEITNPPDFGFVSIPGWVNAFGLSANGAHVPFTISEAARGSFSATFPAIAPGSEVTLSYYFVHDAAAASTNALNVVQYPTPEPATMSLLAIMGAFVFRRRP